MKGRKSKPTGLKVIEGNPGKRPLNENEPKPKLGIPEMPEWIKPFDEAVKNWEHESVLLDEMGIMTKADAGILAARSFLFSQIVDLTKDLKEEGTVLKRDDNSEPKHNPKQKQLESVLREYRTLGSLLGLDPSSRSRLSINKSEGGSDWDGI